MRRTLRDHLTEQGICNVCAGGNKSLNKSPNKLIKANGGEMYVCDICIEDYPHNPVVDEGAKDYVHDLIDDAYTRTEIIDKMVNKGHSRAFAEETLHQVMKDIVSNHKSP